MSEGRACLHLVSTSPNAGRALRRCLRFALPGDAVLLLNTGVLSLCERDMLQSAGDSVRFYALAADIDARGLSGLLHDANCALVDDAGFVDLVTRFPVNQTWA